MSELSTFNSLNRAATGVVSSAIELAAASFIDAENKEIDEMFERLRKDQPEVENVSDNHIKMTYILIKLNIKARLQKIIRTEYLLK